MMYPTLLSKRCLYSRMQARVLLLGGTMQLLFSHIDVQQYVLVKKITAPRTLQTVAQTNDRKKHEPGWHAPAPLAFPDALARAAMRSFMVIGLSSAILLSFSSGYTANGPRMLCSALSLASCAVHLHTVYFSKVTEQNTKNMGERFGG